MKNKKFDFIVIIIITIGFSACDQLAGALSPGSYPFAEHYELKVSEDTLIKCIKNFKREHPEYRPPAQAHVKDGRRDSADYWYHVYIYYPWENQIIKTWVRSINSKSTTLASVAINDGVNERNWKDINKDYSASENEEVKKKFEERILNKLKQKLDLR